MLDAFDSGADPDADLPPWAVPGGIQPIRPARRPPRQPAPGPVTEPEPEPFEPSDEPADEPAGLPVTDWPGKRRRLAGRSRAARARRRRSRRRLLTWGGAAVTAVVIAGAIVALSQPGVVRSQFVTSLQKGEYAIVPNACHVIGGTTLSQLLPGKVQSIQPFNDRQESQCTYTVDAKPVFRVLNAIMQAYQPASYIAAGNGSATANAIYTYRQQRQQMIKPAKNTPQPPATITPIAGLGQEAFSAVQIFHVGAVTDRVTVLVRYHNVLITAGFEAQASNGFGPISISELQAGAVAVARQLLIAVRAEPSV